MPRIGHQQRRAHAFSHAQHVAEQQLFRHQRGRGDVQSHRFNGRYGSGVDDFLQARPQHDERDGNQQPADDERSRILVTVMAVVVVFV